MRRVPGFSLVEMLLVIALIAVLTAMGLGAYGGLSQATALSAGTQQVHDLFAEGRIDAMEQNTPVEVRIYDWPGAPAAYRALQLHWVKADGTRPPIDPVRYLPSQVMIDATAARSTLIASNTIAPVSDATDPHLDANTRVFHFMPDGSTDLAAGTAWFLTLRAVQGAPENWASITLDPVSGRAQIFRP